MKLKPQPLGGADRHRPFPWQLGLFGVSALTAFAYGFFYPTAIEASELIRKYGYFLMGGTFIWWIYSLKRLAPKDGFKRSWALICEHRTACMMIGALTMVGWLTVPYSSKVLYDEFVLQATSWSLHFNREFCSLLRGYEVEGLFRSMAVMVDKRPFFYPFVVSLVHDLTGYRLANAYWVNTLLMPVVLILVYAIFHRVGGRWPGLAALTCFGASALLAQNANGAGMEMLNLAMFVVTLGLAIYYLDEPGDERLAALVLSCVLLAQTRYESALYVLPAALVVLEGWRRVGRIILPPVALAAPLLLIPCALHNTYLSGTPFLWELREDVTSRFDGKYFMGNLGHAGNYLFDFTERLLSSWWLSGLGVVAIGWAGLTLARHLRFWKVAPTPAAGLVLFGGAAAANLCLLMFYFWGQLDDPLVSRLILPFNVIFAAAIAWGAGRISDRHRSVVCGWILGGALLTYIGYGLTAQAYNRTLNQQAWEITWEANWLAKQPPATRLMITNKSGLSWVIHHISSIDMTRARFKFEQVKFHLERGTFQEVLVSQYYRPASAAGGFVLDPRDRLPPVYVLEPLVERQVGAKLLRISRVVKIDLSLAEKAPTSESPLKVATIASTPH